MPHANRRHRELFHNSNDLAATSGRLLPPPSSSPSVGDLPSTPIFPIRSDSLLPSTPPSTGYLPPSDSSDLDYSPPMASDLLPGAPQSLDLMILCEYINSLFKQTGNDYSLPTDRERNSMRESLLSGKYERSDIEAGFLHAIGIVCKARRALRAAIEDVLGYPSEGVFSGAVNATDEAKGFKAAPSSRLLEWEEVDLAIAQKVAVVDLHAGILLAYGAMAMTKMRIVEVYRKQDDIRAQNAETEAGGVDTDEDTDGEDEKEESTEVDSVVEA